MGRSLSSFCVFWFFLQFRPARLKSCSGTNAAILGGRRLLHSEQCCQWRAVLHSLGASRAAAAARWAPAAQTPGPAVCSSGAAGPAPPQPSAERRNGLSLGPAPASGRLRPRGRCGHVSGLSPAPASQMSKQFPAGCSHKNLSTIAHPTHPTRPPPPAGADARGFNQMCTCSLATTLQGQMRAGLAASNLASGARVSPHCSLSSLACASRHRIGSS